MKTKQTHQDVHEKSAEATALLRKVSVAIGFALFASVSATQASTDYGPAIWRPVCNGKWYTSGYGKKFFVEHDMEGYYLSGIAYIQRCDVSVSIHYAINGKVDNGSDAAPGEVSQLVNDVYYAWHVRCWNQHCMGTEHEGFRSNPAWYTPQLYDASAALTKSKAEKYGFAKDRNHIVGHDEHFNAAWRSYAAANLGIDPNCNDHNDPGPYWDWSGFMARINSSAYVPADFNGDGRTDVAVCRPSSPNYQWYVNNGSVPWGMAFGIPGDIPVPGGYDGGATQVAVYRPGAQVGAQSYWYVSGSTAVPWGLPFGVGGDIPVPANYDGGSRSKVAVYRPGAQVGAQSYWYVSGSTTVPWGFAFGEGGDIPVPADYDGIGRAQVAVCRTNTNPFQWYVSGSTTVPWGLNFGVPGDIPVPRNYDGGRTLVAVYRPSTRAWYVWGSTTVPWGLVFGINGDIPVPANYDGGATKVATWRTTTNPHQWYVSGSTTVPWGLSFGEPGDIPVQLSPAIRKLFGMR